MNSDILTVNYGVKQSQFTKPTTDPRASDLKNLIKPLTVRLKNNYCSITVANYLIKLYLVFHTCEILFSENVRAFFLNGKQGPQLQH